jgi:hypothetical protein
LITKKLSYKLMLASLFCASWILTDYIPTRQKNLADRARIEAKRDELAWTQDYGEVKEVYAAVDIDQRLSEAKEELVNLNKNQRVFNNPTTDIMLLAFSGLAMTSVISFIGERFDKRLDRSMQCNYCATEVVKASLENIYSDKNADK